jgi:nucleoside-diphosphate-sugar epimerase
VPALALAGLQGRLPPLASPQVARDFVYVDDALDAFLLAAAHDGHEPGAVYNVGTGQQVTIAEAVAVARAELAIEAEPEWGSMDDRSWDTEVWVADPGKIRTELGWAPQRSFASGLAELADWLRARQDLWAFYDEGARART